MTKNTFAIYITLTVLYSLFLNENSLFAGVSNGSPRCIGKHALPQAPKLFINKPKFTTKCYKTETKGAYVSKEEFCGHMSCSYQVYRQDISFSNNGDVFVDGRNKGKYSCKGGVLFDAKNYIVGYFITSNIIQSYFGVMLTYVSEYKRTHSLWFREAC